MLKNIKNRLGNRKKSELRGTPGESVRDAIIKAGIKTAENSGYAAGNLTEKLVDIATSIGVYVDRATELCGGVESSTALGTIAYKTVQDAARADTVCTGLCVISAACETISLGCSTIKIIPFRGKIYVCAKIVSRGCMTYRNLCAGKGC